MLNKLFAALFLWWWETQFLPYRQYRRWGYGYGPNNYREIDSGWISISVQNGRLDTDWTLFIFKHRFTKWWDAHILEPVATLALRLFIHYRDYLPYEFGYLGKGCPKWLWEAFTAYQDNEKVVVPEGPEGTFTLDQVIAANGWESVIPGEDHPGRHVISLDEERYLEAFHGSL